MNVKESTIYAVMKLSERYSWQVWKQERRRQILQTAVKKSKRSPRRKQGTNSPVGVIFE